MNILGSISGSQDTHSEMRSMDRIVKQQAVKVVRTVTDSTRQKWRGHYNLVGAQGRTQLHETGSNGVRH